jgi:hypothetical protein
MSSIKRVIICPLNRICERIKDDVIERCAWYTEVKGMNPQTGQEVDEFGCAVSWLPVLLIEGSRMARSTTAAVESFRNEMVNPEASMPMRQVLSHILANINPLVIEEADGSPRRLEVIDQGL